MPYQVAAIPYFQLRKGAPFWPREPSFGAILPSTPLVGSKFTEFYCNAAIGSQTNSGSTESATPYYTSAGGNWVQLSRVFTVTDGSNPGASIKVGDFAHVYVTASAVPTFFGRILSVDNVVNGNIVLDSVAKAGSSPANGTGTLTIKVGGCWKGPNVGDGFPLVSNFSSFVPMTNLAGQFPRCNMKNNAQYLLTTAATYTGVNGFWFEGYANTPGDGGRAVINNNTTAAITLSWTNVTSFFINLEFATSSTSGGSWMQLNTSSYIRGCSIHGAWSNGINLPSGSGQIWLVETEIYNCNRSNVLGAAIQVNGGMSVNMYCCYIHDNPGGSSHGIYISGNPAQPWNILNCIFKNNGGMGMLVGPNAGGAWFILNNDFYNNGSDAINIQQSSNVIQNNNFLKNGGRAINITGQVMGFCCNNGYGQGSMANFAPNALSNYVEVGAVNYLPGVTPWVSPSTGDFRINLAAAIGAGRGAFLSSESVFAGYPDIGAAPHASSSLPPNWGDQIVTLPDAYVNHAYVVDWLFDEVVTVTLQSGSLPPGLALSTVSSVEAHITGTPTGVINTSYTFTLRATVPTGGSADSIFTITVRADPAVGAGIGLVGGG